VAQRAGVSIATVSRVINGAPVKISEHTAVKVREAAAELDYRPQSAGRVLRQGTSRVVGLLAANLGNPVMAAIAASVEHALRQQGDVMLLADTHEQPDIQDEYLREMGAQLVRAIVMVVAVPSPKLDELRRRGTPLIFVNRRDPASAKSPYVGIDNIAAGRDVAAYCLRRGWRRPAVVHASIAYSAGKERLAGFLAGMTEGGVASAEIARHGRTGSDHLLIGDDAMAQMLSGAQRPRVVVCLSDLMAYGVYHRANEAGLKVPEDIAIISFDDGPLNAWITPWLSAIRAPYERFGTAVTQALDRIAQSEKAGDTLLPHALIIRDPGWRDDRVTQARSATDR
jgi:LacI family transcriptional regulator